MAALMAASSIAFSFDGLQMPVEDRHFALQMFSPMTTWREVFDFMPPDEVLSTLVSESFPSGCSGEVYARDFRQAIAGPALSEGFSFGSIAPSSFQAAMRQSAQAAASRSAVQALPRTAPELVARQPDVAVPFPGVRLADVPALPSGRAAPKTQKRLSALEIARDPKKRKEAQ